jgi:hypothetical protein
MSLTMGKWLKAHWKAVLVHSLILSGFLFFCIFLSDSLFGRFEPIAGESELQGVSLPAVTEGMLYHVDGLRGGAYIAEVWGWAYIDGQSSDNSQVYLVLKSGDKCYVFDTMTLLKAYNDLTIVSYRSGFVCNIPSSQISSGEYVLGIYIKKGDTQALQYTDMVLVKSESAVQWDILKQQPEL